MTARPFHHGATEDRLRVLKGRSSSRRFVAPWMVVVLIAVIGFLGLIFARTSLDNSAFELAELERSIAEQSALNQQLSLTIARLENPAHIAPLAEELGMVIPVSTNQILVDLSPSGPTVVSVEAREEAQ
jgi:cell division protein FtsB